MAKLIDVADIDDEGRSLSLRFEGEEAEAIAGRLALPSLDALTADLFLVKAEKGRGLSVSGSFAAQFEQICGVTLEPFPVSLSGAIDVLLLPEDLLTEMSAIESDELQSADDMPSLELLEDGQFDPDDLVITEFSLAIDPYPRKPDAKFESPEADEPDEDDKAPSPFAVLASLKKSDPKAND